MNEALEIIKEVFPNFYKNHKKRIWISFAIVCVAFLVFNSGQYKHWKYYNKDNLNVYCEKYLPILKNNKTFYYKYILFIQNNYSKEITLTDLKVQLTSSLYLTDFKILLCDFKEEDLDTTLRDFSEFSIRTKSIRGSQNIAVAISCQFAPRIDNAVFFDNSANLTYSYKLFEKYHSENLLINPITNFDERFIKQKSDVIFDILKILDQRKVPRSFYEYTFSKLESEDRSITVVLGRDGRGNKLKINYIKMTETIHRKSTKVIEGNFVMMRLVVFKNDDMIIKTVPDLGPFPVY